MIEHLLIFTALLLAILVLACLLTKALWLWICRQVEIETAWLEDVWRK